MNVEKEVQWTTSVCFRKHRAVLGNQNPNTNRLEIGYLRDYLNPYDHVLCFAQFAAIC